MTLLKASRLMQISIGISFFWFGMLKFFSGMSPAEQLAIMTMDVLTFGIIPSATAIKLLALWEVLIGLGLLFGRQIRWVLVLFFVHMGFTFSPLVLFPEICFTHVPYALTLVGQYIVKNLVLIMGGVIIYILDTETKQ